MPIESAIVIETVGVDGTEWGVSFEGPNPPAEKYVAMKDKDAAFRAARLIISCSVPSHVPQTSL